MTPTHIHLRGKGWKFSSGFAFLPQLSPRRLGFLFALNYAQTYQHKNPHSDEPNIFLAVHWTLPCPARN